MLEVLTNILEDLTVSIFEVEVLRPVKSILYRKSQVTGTRNRRIGK